MGKIEWSRIIFALCAGLVILVMVAIFVFVGLQAFQTFTVNHINPGSFFFGTKWDPQDGADAGALQLIVGTFSVTILAVVLSTPISVAVALFVTEVAPPWARSFMQPVLELLTGIPSIIYGLLALSILVPLISNILNNLVEPNYTTGYGLIGAALVLTIMILPTITTISIDALASLPAGLREANLALGATRWQTIRKTLVRAAAPGIFTGVILGMGRAIGETLAVFFIIGPNADSVIFPIKFLTAYPYIELPPTSTMTVQTLFEFAEAGPGSLDYNAIWTLAFFLLAISFLLVVVGRWISSRGIYSAPRSGGLNVNVLNVNFLRRGRSARVAPVGATAPVSAASQASIEGGASWTSIAEGTQVAVGQPDRRASIHWRARLMDRLVTGVLWVTAIAVVAILVYIILDELLPGLNVLNWTFLTTAGSTGIAPEIFNTFYIVILALIISVPIAVSASIYLVEYARPGPFVTIVRFATDTLAGIPSLVLGLFGFLVLVTHFGYIYFFGYSRLAGAITIAILNLPLLLRVTEDALTSVPNDLRESSAALGTTKFKTVARVILPTAVPGITTGIILTIGRMIGETAALIYTAGTSSSINGWLTLNPLTSGDTLTVHLYELQTEGLGRTVPEQIAGTAAVLIVLILIFNLGFCFLSGRLNRRLSGGTKWSL